MSEAKFTPMVIAAARALARDHAEVCNVNADDLWNLESEDFKRMAQLALDAAGAPELLKAMQEAVALADKNCPEWNGEPDRTPECKASYDKCVAAIRKATGQQ